MVTLTHEVTGQEIEVSELTLDGCEYVHVKDLGWWGTDGDAWFECPKPEVIVDAAQISLPPGCKGGDCICEEAEAPSDD